MKAFLINCFVAFLLAAQPCASLANRSDSDLPRSQSTLTLEGTLETLLMLPLEPVQLARRQILRHQYRSLVKKGLAKKAQASTSLLADSPASCEPSFDLLRPYQEWRDVLQVADKDGIEFSTQQSVASGEFFNFENSNEDFENTIKRTLGFCWGFADAQRLFKVLARFDGSRIRPNFEVTQAQIDRLFSGRVAHFDGYQNLFELSSISELAAYLKAALVQHWKNKAFNVGSIAVYLKSYVGIQNRTQNQKLISRLQKKLTLHQTPIIIFGHSELKNFIHTVGVYEIREAQFDSITQKKYTRICIINNHGSAFDHDDCGQHVRIYDDGRLSYPEWGLDTHLRYAVMAPEDDQNQVRLIKELARECKSNI